MTRKKISQKKQTKKIVKIMELVDKHDKTAIRNMFKYLKKKKHEHSEEMGITIFLAGPNRT